MPLIDILKYRRNGDKLILWTCREGEMLDFALEWCNYYGLFFDAVNDNLDEIKRKYSHNSRKITADIYVDDKAMPWEWLRI